MSQRTLVRFKVVSIAIFIIGLVSATVAFSIQRATSRKQRHRIGFTIVTKQITIPFVPIQNSDWYTITVRYQKSDGKWRQVRTPRNAEGKVLKRDITVGVPGKGVFKVDKDQGTLDFLSSMPAKEVTSYVPITDGRNDPSYLKDDWVFGYKTYVLRFPHDDGGYVDL